MVFPRDGDGFFRGLQHWYLRRGATRKLQDETTDIGELENIRSLSLTPKQPTRQPKRRNYDIVQLSLCVLGMFGAWRFGSWFRLGTVIFLTMMTLVKGGEVAIYANTTTTTESRRTSSLLVLLMLVAMISFTVGCLCACGISKLCPLDERWFWKNCKVSEWSMKPATKTLLRPLPRRLSAKAVAELVQNDTLRPGQFTDRFCKCGVQLRRKISHSARNPGRPHVSCSICKYFRWLKDGGDNLTLTSRGSVG